MPKDDLEELVARWLKGDPDAMLIWHDGNDYPSIGTIDRDGWAWLQGAPFGTSVVEAKYVDAAISVAAALRAHRENSNHAQG